MKAIIFNSGLGKRMGDFTKTNHKSMVVLENGETIFERQVRILNECGINEFIVTIGPHKDQLINASRNFKNCKFIFVENPIYDKTNYIYSMYLAIPYLNSDIFLLHGDLVFNKKLIEKMLNDERKSICLINEEKKLPEKDFKGRIKNGKLKEVSINIFDDDCYAFQPLYKLSKNDLIKWCNKVIEFVEEGNTNVYAENALNEIIDNMDIFEMSYKDDYIDEIDNIDDYKRVNREIFEFEDKNGKKNII